MASSNLDIRLIQETNLGQNYPIRTERIAYIRNLLIDAVPRDFDYFFMADLDDVFSPNVKKESFESCFRYTGWDVMTACSVKYGYYDAWALRIPGLLETDCWNIIFAYHEKGIGTEVKRHVSMSPFRPVFVRMVLLFSIILHFNYKKAGFF